MNAKNILIVAGVVIVGYMIWKKSKPVTAVKSDNSNAIGGSKCRCRNALGGYTDVPCPCPAPKSIFK